MARMDEGEVAGARRGTRDPTWSREGPPSTTDTSTESLKCLTEVARIS
jgi:hypothetical protein